MTSSILFGGCHNISQGDIVSSDEEGLVQQAFLKVFRNGPFQHQEFEFGGMIVLFVGCEGLAAIGYWVIMPVYLFLGSTTPSPSLEASV